MPESPAAVVDAKPQNPPVGVSMTPDQSEQRDREIYRRINAEPSAPETTQATQQQPPTSRPASEPSPQQPAPDKGEQSPEDDGNRRELETIARVVLGRDKVKGAALDALLSLPETELKSLLDERRQAQSERDKFGNELRDLKQKLEKAQPKAPEADPAEELGKYLEAQFGDAKAAELLKKVLDTRTPKQEAAEVTQAPHGPTTAAEVAFVLREPLDHLQTTYPALKDTAARVALVERAQRLALAGVVTGQFANQREYEVAALNAAARISYEADAPDPQRAQRDMIQRHRLEATGQPTRPQSGRTAPKVYSQEEIDRAGYRMLAEGSDPKDVQRKLQKMSGG